MISEFIQRHIGPTQEEQYKMLNDLGYGVKENLTLDLVYNPVGAHLPPAQDKLEKVSLVFGMISLLRTAQPIT